ncbi:MAG: hypothetical protein IJE88_02095, partial [Akkermansia sp.]|nr:hypothetical protein [Akkermansia sp.]
RDRLPPAHFVRGSDMFFVLPSVPPRGGSTLGYYYVALTGSEFLGLSARQIPIYRALFSNFGHMCQFKASHAENYRQG